ncbi:hypothetical protein Hanom_Chr08g00710321 [Helianthus anomalus]
MHNVTTLTEKGSGPLSLNAPAITTCGCDAISPVSPSALDLIKKETARFCSSCYHWI